MSRDRSEIIERIYMAPRSRRERALDAAAAALEGEEDLLLVKQSRVAKMLDCSRFTVGRLVKDGALHPVNIRGLVRYRVSELKALV